MEDRPWNVWGNKMDSGEIQFKSGRKLYANRNYIGINEKLELSAGYDREIMRYFRLWMDEEDMKEWLESDIVDIHEDDTIELSRIMIDRWERFALMYRDKLKKE
jgi:hypothetical protein